MHENVEVFYEEESKMDQAAKRKKIDRNIELLKSRHLAAKNRRLAKQGTEEKLRILQHFRWPLVKYVREKSLAEKYAEISKQRWARTWLVLVAAKKMITEYY